MSGYLGQFRLKQDLPAGFVVFLVALPLCLGIALASNAPLFSGVIAGIIGGILIGILSGSEVSVSGPAAGLAVIVAASIQKLGAFDVFLLSVALSGVFQIILSFLRAGSLANYVPSSVIKGMLAAIGIVIILKQIPHALGWDNNYEGDLAFLQSDNSNTFSAIYRALAGLNLEAFLISAISIAILLLWERPAIKTHPLLKRIPAPLIVVLLGVALNESFRLLTDNFYLRAEDDHLVALPVSASLGDFFSNFTLPNWNAFTNKEVYTVALTIAVVGSLETLLSIEAADKIDPFKRISDTNKELRAQGIGNIFSGLIGGLPITSVVVRTSANVYAGGETRLSSIMHGALMLLCAMLIPALLNKIPLASLASILILVGYKLANAKLFTSMYRAGLTEFLPFIATVLAVVFTDLLIGIGIGLLVGFFFVLRTNHHDAITLVHEDRFYLMRLNKDLSFVNKAELKEKLMMIPDGAVVIIDGAKAMFIDADIEDTINNFRQAATFRQIEIEFKHFHTKVKSTFKTKSLKTNHTSHTTDGLVQKVAAR
jgi:MFS superfamily sulfate permease-like transporter